MPKSFYRSFAGGEITPELFGRLDLSKWQTGLRLARNFRTLPHGPADRRTGFVFVNESYVSSTPVRLIPFVYSATQSVMLEFGDHYVRFHTNQGTTLEASKIITAMTNANPGVFTIAAHGYANNDWVYLSTMTAAGVPALDNSFFIVANVTANTFTLKRLDGSAVDTTTLGAYGGGGRAARVYTLLSPYSATDLFTLTYAQDSDVLTLSSTLYATRELRRTGPTSWVFSTVIFAPPPANPAPGVVATIPTPGTASNQTYVYTAVFGDSSESLPSPSTTVGNPLNLAGNYNTISWGAVVGAVRYNVFKLRGGIFGYIGSTTTLSLVDDNILPDTAFAPPENTITLNTVGGQYPAAVTYLERRRWFAGTNQQPQTIWATRNATSSNLTTSTPSRDDDAMEFKIAAQQQNAIRHLVPLTDLLALTVGGEFRIFADGGPALSPETLSIKPQGFSGASIPQPALTSGSALYVQAQGSRVREIAYDANGSGAYKSSDASLLATHLFNGYTITELAYTRAPESALWAVRSDGKLLGMTYVPDQQVFGWHQHDTNGTFESCAVIPENNEDVLYVVVRRTINGRSVRYIERMHTRFFSAQEDAFYVDAGLTYDGTPVTTLSGLWHLEGEEVQILADGAVVLGKTVSAGRVVLDTAASVVHVGLQFVSDFQTLPLAYEGAPAAGQGTMKNVSQVHMRVVNSSLIKAGPSFSKLREYPARQVSDPYDSPPSLQTFEARLPIDPSWSTDGSVCVRQDQPLPLTVAAMALDTQVGG